MTGWTSSRGAVSGPGRRYRIFNPDRTHARAEARRLAAQEYDVELEEILVLDIEPFEDTDDPAGWFVAVTLG
jgi:hypothetical protein